MHLITRKIDNPIKKWVKELNRHFSKEDIQTATNTCKEAQHHSLSEKCKSKPQWGIISCWSEWLPSKSLQAKKSWKECGESRSLLHSWWKSKLEWPLWGRVWRYLKELGIGLPYNTTVPHLGTHTEESRIESGTCIPMEPIIQSGVREQGSTDAVY